MNLTGMAPGRVRPIIYFRNASGYVILAPEEVGQGLAVAKQIYEQRYKHQGWEWCETDGTLRGAASLQKKLQDQERAESEQKRNVTMGAYDRAKSDTASRLRQVMQSSATTQWERDFIRIWLGMSDEKRQKYEQRYAEHQSYLWALEQDANTKVTDRMPSEDGDFWRNDQQQKA